MADFNELWKQFPSTLPDFEERFPDEEACRDYLIELRWGGIVKCARCSCDETWELSCGRFECQVCGFQTSVTAGTPLHGTRKPLRIWFRAIWEIAVRNNGISAKDLQRIMGFGSYKTAWAWLHRLRQCMTRPDRDCLSGSVVADEGFVGARSSKLGRGGGKSVILVVAEDTPGGRTRIEHAPDVKGRTIAAFMNRHVDPKAHTTTDGFVSYILGTYRRPHTVVNQSKEDLSKVDALQRCHHVISLFKRLWIGTYHGGVWPKHMQAYLSEFEFRFNRRCTKGKGRLAARLFQNLVRHSPITYAEITSSPTTPRFSQT